MRIDRVRINGKSYYFVDGAKISSDALSIVISGVYGKDVCSQVYRNVTKNGSTLVEQYVGGANQQLVEQLERANKKIAILEKKVSELALQNIYMAVEED